MNRRQPKAKRTASSLDWRCKPWGRISCVTMATIIKRTGWENPCAATKWPEIVGLYARTCLLISVKPERNSMGGMGSGRRLVGKSTTSDMQPLDIRRLHRAGLLTPGHVFSWQWSVCGKEVASIQIRTEIDRVILDYRSRDNGGEWLPMEYPVYVVWTGVHFGGRRPWFLCPVQGCGRRVAILYGGRMFACRHCQKLAYECQRETYDDRACRRADNIRRQLGWRPGIANPIGGKPRGMHWRTYARLIAEYNSFAQIAWTGTSERLDLLYKKTEELKRGIFR